MAEEQVLKKYNHENMLHFIPELELDSKLQEELGKYTTDMQIINFLVRAEQYEPALKFLAMGLPKREAIWWAYICTEELEGEKDCLKTKNALRIIQEWVKQPDDNLRRQAGDLGEALEFYTPTSWTATAVFWSGGSIAPKGKPEADPTPYMCAQSVANAITLAAEQSDDTPAKMQLFLKRGLHIAMGGNGRI
ncbi:MAG: hypothetical protein KAS93_01210 [Gammaproteobacteria bacterium]|nr:hypothetical protein [Gammaproteobacteria bacterium]